MKRSRWAVAAAGALCAAVVVPTGAGAATRPVTMGTSVAQQKQLRDTGADVNDFFPHSTRIHVGDKVKFTVPAGFHTFEFPKKGTDPAELVVPDGNTIAGVNDAAGQPFWFNGQPELNFNGPELAANPLYGKSVSYDGKKDLASGVSLAPGTPKPINVKFTRAGKYTYYCNVHPGMIGKVTVVKKGKKAPSAKAHKKLVKTQFKRDLKIAKGLANVNVPAGVVDVGVAGKHGVELYGMLPAKVNVAVGKALQFRMTKGSFELHTATTGPGNPETEPDSYMGQIAKSFEGDQIDQRGLYPSEPPSATAVLTPALHGNGFWSSGALDTVPGNPAPGLNSVQFSTPGTYQFYCMIHPFMSTEVTVQ
jgi:plastocyanin